MIQSPTDNVIVLPKTKFISNFTDIIKTAQIYANTSLGQQDMVNIIGEVISLPLSISKTRDLEGFSIKDIRVGDTAIFSYQVIFDTVQKGELEEPIYKNLLSYNAKEYFTANIRNIYGVIRDGKIIMINGYVMITTFEEPKIVLSAEQKRVRGTIKSQIMYIGNPKENLTAINAQAGDYVYFNPKLVQKYQINGKPFCIIQQHQILGKSEKNEDYLEIIQEFSKN